MQLAWSRIWTLVAVSISYDDNHYTTGHLMMCITWVDHGFSSRVLHVLFVLLGGLLVGCVVWHISLCRLSNAKSIFVQNNQFYFKQFILAWVHNLIVKNISISNYSVYSSSSSSSCCTASMDIPDPLSPLLPIVHRLWQVFRATSHILTQLLYVCSS